MFRLGLFFGLAVGYVLGAQAGRERYEQIREYWAKISGSEPAQQLGAEVRDVVNRAGDRLEAKSTEGVNRVSDMARRDSRV